MDAFICLATLGGKEVGKGLKRWTCRCKTVIATDSDPETLEWTRKGYTQGTIAQRPFTMGFVGLKMLDGLHLYKPRSFNGAWAKEPLPPIPSFVNTGVIWIHEQNVVPGLPLGTGAFRIILPDCAESL